MTEKTPDKILYRARVTSSGGRGGRTTSEDGVLVLALTAPAELGGPGTGTNPEQLFAAGYSACFNSALGGVAKKEGVEASGSTVTATVGLGTGDDGYALTVELAVAIPGQDLATVQRLAEGAHEVCPYSKATRGNIPVTITAVPAA